MLTQRVGGREVLLTYRSEIEDLHSATGTPITARMPWLETWIECFSDHQPLAILVANEVTGRVDAAAVLAWKRYRSGVRIVAAGHGPSDRVALPVRTPDAAKMLAASIVHACGTLHRRWRLSIRHLPSGDPVVRQLIPLTSWALLAGDSSSPTTRFTEDRSLRSYVSRNHHQQIRRLRNRVARDDLSYRIDHLRSPRQISQVLKEVEGVCLLRDRDMGRASQLDDVQLLCFFRTVIHRHAERGEVLLTTLRLNDELAAYVLCFRDGPAYRMWNCRFSPRWKTYGPGRLANAAALSEVLADTASREFDWMLGDEPYKASLANDAVPDERFFCTSSSLMLVAERARQHGRRLAHQRPNVHASAVWINQALQRYGKSLRSLRRASRAGRP